MERFVKDAALRGPSMMQALWSFSFSTLLLLPCTVLEVYPRCIPIDYREEAVTEVLGTDCSIPPGLGCAVPRSTLLPLHPWIRDISFCDPLPSSCLSSLLCSGTARERVDTGRHHTTAGTSRQTSWPLWFAFLPNPTPPPIIDSVFLTSPPISSYLALAQKTKHLQKVSSSTFASSSSPTQIRQSYSADLFSLCPPRNSSNPERALLNGLASEETTTLSSGRRRRCGP